MFWTRTILWKIIKVLEYLIGMVRYYPARKKKYFFCPILDTSTLPKISKPKKYPNLFLNLPDLQAIQNRKGLDIF